MLQLFNTFNRLVISPSAASSRTITTDNSLWFKISSILYGEPLKRKKKMDPAIVKAREDRRRRKLEKSIKKLKKQANRPKPIEEIEVPYELQDQLALRTRPAVQWSKEDEQEKLYLLRQWNEFRSNQRLQDFQLIDRMVYSQQKALDELKQASPRLYEAAIQIDTELLPYSAKGPVHTPPIKNYESPDGDYSDVSRKWE